MRMLMKVSIPVAAGNRAIKDGTLAKTVAAFVERHHPEASYFVTEQGRRTALFVFDMKDPTVMPAAAEPFFMNLEAAVECSPVMNAQDLQAGLERLPKA